MDDKRYDKEFLETLHQYEAACKAGGSIYLEPDELTDIAEYYYQHSRVDEAIATAEQAMAMFPGAADPLLFRARIALQYENNADKAEQLTHQVDDTDELEYYYITAEIMLAREQDEEADSYLAAREAQVDEDDLEDFRLDAAGLFSSYSNYELAEKWLAKCQDTDFDDYREIEGQIAMGTGQYERSEKIFNHLIDRDPYCIEYWNELASAQYMANNPSGSLESSDFALAINARNPDAVINKANSLMMLQNYDEALRYYRLFASLQPYDEAGSMGIASVLSLQNRSAEALPYLEQAERLSTPGSGTYFEILCNKCYTHAAMGNYGLAFDVIDQIARDGGSMAEQDMLRAYVFLRQGDEPQAVAHYRKAMAATDPKEQKRGQFFFATSAFGSEHPALARQIFGEMAGDDTGDEWPDVWVYLALCDHRLGQREDFLRHLRTAVERNGDETLQGLADLFPSHIAPADYYRYALTHPDMAARPSGDTDTHNPSHPSIPPTPL